MKNKKKIQQKHVHTHKLTYLINKHQPNKSTNDY